MIKDYEVEKQILDKLEELKELKKIKEEYDYVDASVDEMLSDFYGDSEALPESLKEAFKKLLNNMSALEVTTIAKALIKDSDTYLKAKKAKLTDLTANDKEIRDTIGTLIMNEAEYESLKEKSVNFVGYGTVKCTIKPTPVVVDEEKVIRNLAKDDSLIKYLTISKRELLKHPSVGDVEGIEMVDKMTTTIRTDAK